MVWPTRPLTHGFVLTHNRLIYHRPSKADRFLHLLNKSICLFCTITDYKYRIHNTLVNTDCCRFAPFATMVCVPTRHGMGMGSPGGDQRREHHKRLVRHSRPSKLQPRYRSRTRWQAVCSGSDLLLGDRSERLSYGDRHGNVQLCVSNTYVTWCHWHQ